MTTFTSTLPDDVFQHLNEKAKKLSLPKNKIIERSLQLYLDQLNRAEYLKSYQQADGDKDILAIAEEGIADYFLKLSNLY